MPNSPDYTNYTDMHISSDLTTALTDLRTISGNTMELNIMTVIISGIKCAVVTIEGMASVDIMADMLYTPIMKYTKEKAENTDVFDYLTKESLLAAERKTLFTYGDVFQFLFSGFALVLIDGLEKAVAFGIQGYASRSISTPENEQTIYASKDAFTEIIRTNISLIRRRMKTPSMRFEMMQVGKRSSTDVCMVYLVDRTSPEMVAKVRRSLEKIKLDTVLSTAYIEPFVDDSYTKTLFSSFAKSERPDMVCKRLNEGKICILVDGTPFALVFPVLLSECFQTMDDYSSKCFYATFIRWIKYIAFFLTVFFPGIYVALVLFHPEVFTLKLLLNLYASEEATPYPLTLEVIVLMIMFEVMREAGLRLPKSIGSAISIVGGLIIGDAAVKSGIISAPLLIVVGITATSSFVVPNLNQPITILRLIFILAGGCTGLFGIAVCAMVVLANICAMNDFYIPFTAPVSPFYPQSAKEVAARSTFKHYQRVQSSVEDFRSDE